MVSCRLPIHDGITRPDTLSSCSTSISYSAWQAKMCVDSMWNLDEDSPGMVSNFNTKYAYTNFFIETDRDRAICSMNHDI